MKSKNESPRICFVLPHADPGGHDHFDHVTALAREVNRIQPKGAMVVGLAFRGMREPGRWERTLRAPERWLRAIQVLKNARDAGFTVFFIHYSYLGLLAARSVTRRRGGKTLYWHCGEPWLYAKKDPWGSGWMLRRVLRSADRVLTGSETLRDRYIRHFGLPGERVAVLPSWVEPWRPAGESKARLRKKLKLPVAGKIVLFAHRLSTDRGCLLLPEIAAIVRKRFPGMTLVVAGDGPARARVEAEASKLGLKDTIVFRGWVERAAMRKLFGASDVLIVPSLRAGIPRNILEAFTMGLPVVATNVGGTADLFQGPLAWYCMAPGDVNRLAAGVEKLLGNPREAGAFIRHAAAAARPHHVRVVAGKLLALVDDLSVR